METPDTETDAGPPRGSARPERRCIATMQRLPQDQMIRFVLGPEGRVTADLAQRLPGRGAWVTSTRDALSLAIRKGAFARAFRTQVRAEPALVGEVEALFEKRLLDGLGLLRRGDNIVSGHDQVREWVRANRPACLIEAADGSADGRQSVIGLAKAVHAGPDGSDMPALVGCFTGEQLGMALGRARVIHACLKLGRASAAWMGELARFGGFRPLAPTDWIRPSVSGPCSGAAPDGPVSGAPGAAAFAGVTDTGTSE